MLEYKLDVSEKSHAHVFNVDENARLFSLYATEIGHYHANPGYFTRRDGKMSALLLYTCSGQGVMHWKKQVCSLTAGTAVIIYCDTFQQYYTGDADEWEFFFVHFDGAGLKGYAASLLDRLTPVRLRAVGEMEEAFRRLLALRAESDLLARAEVNCLLSGMLRSMLESLYRTDSEENRSHREVQLLTKYIHDHMSENIGMAEFEKITHYSKYYLIHLFHVVKYRDARIRLPNTCAPLLADIRDGRQHEMLDLSGHNPFHVTAAHVSNADNADSYVFHASVPPKKSSLSGAPRKRRDSRMVEPAAYSPNWRA